MLFLSYEFHHLLLESLGKLMFFFIKIYLKNSCFSWERREGKVQGLRATVSVVLRP